MDWRKSCRNRWEQKIKGQRIKARRTRVCIILKNLSQTRSREHRILWVGPWSLTLQLDREDLRIKLHLSSRCTNWTSTRLNHRSWWRISDWGKDRPCRKLKSGSILRLRLRRDSLLHQPWLYGNLKVNKLLRVTLSAAACSARPTRSLWLNKIHTVTLINQTMSNEATF